MKSIKNPVKTREKLVKMQQEKKGSPEKSSIKTRLSFYAAQASYKDKEATSGGVASLCEERK